MESNNFEKSNIEIDIPDNILNLYKIYGCKDVAYKAYLKSGRNFDSKINNLKINPENKNLLSKTKDEILSQPESQIATYIIKALYSNDIEIQRMGASLVDHVPENQKVNLNEIVFKKVIEGLNNQDIQIQRIAINMVQFVSEDKKENLREIVLQKINDVFNSTDVDKQRIMAKKIKETPVNKQENLRNMVNNKVVEILNSRDIKNQRLASVMVQYAPTEKQVELKGIVNLKFNLAKQQNKFNEIVESSLYTKSTKSMNSRFSHENFSKTGSETTLLTGMQFKNNLIVRHIEEPCFSIWRKLYESYNNWINAGFDYVPIEPIYSFNFDEKNGLINVTSGVLDINLEEWYAFSGDAFKKELDLQKNKIIKVLSDLNVDHGHDNDANFCLRFCRDENGNVDLNKIPRIFLIDFDKVVQCPEKL